MNWVGYAWWWITEHATVLSAVASAVAAIAIACFTKTLVRVSTDQLRELSRSVDVAERAVQIAVERPWLFVSGVHQLICEPARVGGLEPFVIYMAANHGKAPAIVEDVRARGSAGRPISSRC